MYVKFPSETQGEHKLLQGLIYRIRKKIRRKIHDLSFLFVILPFYINKKYTI